MKDINIARRAESLGVRSVPSVLIDGKLAGRGVDEQVSGPLDSERRCSDAVTISCPAG